MRVDNFPLNDELFPHNIFKLRNRITPFLRPRSNPPTQLVYLFMAARFQPCYGNNLITLILFLAFSAYTFTRKTRIISPPSLPLGTHTRVRVGWAARISYLIQFSFNILSVRKKHCEAAFVLFHARHVCLNALLTSRLEL